jgi:hypothetical protein
MFRVQKKQVSFGFALGREFEPNVAYQSGGENP